MTCRAVRLFESFSDEELLALASAGATYVATRDDGHAVLLRRLIDAMGNEAISREGHYDRRGDRGPIMMTIPPKRKGR